jgi:hypothetical protein
MSPKTIEDLRAELAAYEEQAKPLRMRLEPKYHKNGQRIIACSALGPKEQENLFRLDAVIERLRFDITAIENGKARRERNRRDRQD